MELTRKLKENAKKFCKEISMVNETNRFALAMLFDILKEDKESIDEAKKICEKLIEVDKIRKSYWLWYKEQIDSGNWINLSVST